MPVPFKVKAVYEYKSEEPDDLNFGNGQIITVIDEDDADWYTGEYQDASGQRVEGIFPRNFVEKYEPAIPSRPARNRAPPPAEPKAQEAPKAIPSSPPQTVTDARFDPPQESRQPQPVEQAVTQKPTESVPAPAPAPVSRTPSLPIESKPVAGKPAPPVVDKPSSSSFRDRIAAFNKPAAAPVTPFKPGGGGASFVKKPFVAPPPSRNSYVPPPAQPAPQKVYRRDEDVTVQRGDTEIEQEEGIPTNAHVDLPAEDDQPKPTSLKDRIALLQQQQLEQAQKATEKKKIKRPPTQRTDSADNAGDTVAPAETPLTRQQTGDTLGKRSIDTSRLTESDLAEDDRQIADDTPVPTTVPAPSRELVSDTNDADDSGAGDTEDALGTSTEEERHNPAKAKSPPQTAEKVGGSNADEDEEGTEEDEEDEETRRRRELRERMAKMSGGMGMMGMFGGGMPAPSRKPKPSGHSEYHAPEPQSEADMQRAPPVPIMALPGMTARPRQPQPEEEDSDTEEVASHTSVEASRPNLVDDDNYPGQFTRSSTERSIPAVPQERAVPLPAPRETRAVPPPPADRSVPEVPRSPPTRAIPPPPPVVATEEALPMQMDDIPPSMPARTTLERERSTRAPPASGMAPPLPGRRSTEESPIESAPVTSFADRRTSRAPPPPIPGQSPLSPQARAPPPPPPGQPPIRRPTGGSTEMREPLNSDEESEGEVTEYDGDYDTDIASSAKHKDALKAHNRYSSMDDEGTFTDDAAKQASSPPVRAVPPLPPTAAPREVPPPPLPTQTMPRSRPSTDIPRSLPPPVPTSRPNDDEYDPYSYQAPQHGMPTPPIRAPQSPPLQSPAREYEEEDMYSASAYPPPRMPPPPTGPLPPMPASRDGPPPPPVERAAPPPPPPSGPLPAIPSAAPMLAATAPPKQSMDVGRHPTVRRSADMTRSTGDHGFIASDLDLAFASGWWTHENTPPPSVQARPDVLYEVESSTSTKRGGKTTVTRDVYVLYMDYSQTTINVTFDVNDPSQPSISQSHERPPPPPRQDQLESASATFGSQISRAASGTSGNTVGDGSAQSLVYELLRPLQSTALMPIGTRSYGALVYANLANASTQQFDEIRPGDIVTFRNAKFAGHKGGLHAKYSMDVGKPDHVGVVIDWDGTKKKIRAWEQGREEKGKKAKVRDESFRVGDLKSGEVRVWRVMPRGWVGWNNS